MEFQWVVDELEQYDHRVQRGDFYDPPYHPNFFDSNRRNLNNSPECEIQPYHNLKQFNINKLASYLILCQLAFVFESKIKYPAFPGVFHRPRGTIEICPKVGMEYAKRNPISVSVSFHQPLVVSNWLRASDGNRVPKPMVFHYFFPFVPCV